MPDFLKNLDITPRELIFAGSGLVLGMLLLWALTPASVPPTLPTVVVDTDSDLETEPGIADPEPPAPPPPPSKEGLNLQPATFADLPGWTEDDQSQALAAFERSCTAWRKQSPTKKMDGAPFAGSVADWLPACAADRGANPRAFFEGSFTPFLVSEGEKADGLFTGYYVPKIPGSLTATDRFRVPLLARPDDLVAVNLGLHAASLEGQILYGRVEDGKLTRYYTREEIETGQWSNHAQPVIWLEDPVDAFFVHIQGSTLVELEDGSVLRIGFDGKNGHPYTSVGRYLINADLLPASQASMQGIRAWVAANPGERESVLHRNKSYVFFQRQQADGAIGAQNVPLIAQRSLAVDRRYIPLGAPLFLVLDGPHNQDVSNRLMIAQDTGGAIKGMVRGDFYWGEGTEAGERAGRMKQSGHYYILLPNGLAGRVAASPAGAGA